MVLEIVDEKTYQKIIGDYKYFYNSMAFHELNRKKADIQQHHSILLIKK